MISVEKSEELYSMSINVLSQQTKTYKTIVVLYFEDFLSKAYFKFYKKEGGGSVEIYQLDLEIAKAKQGVSKI